MGAVTSVGYQTRVVATSRYRGSSSCECGERSRSARANTEMERTSRGAGPLGGVSGASVRAAARRAYPGRYAAGRSR